jgi:site-specific DNA recombinase
MVRACIYTRLSVAPDGSTEKVERQEADSRDVAGRLHWDVGRTYVDNSKSAWRRDVIRKDWEQMLVDLHAGLWEAVVVYHGDRLIRQPWDLERLLTIADERHLQLASVSGTRDLSNPDDRFILRIEAAQACRESDNISRRTRRGNRAAAEAGRPRQGRRRAYGWTGDGTELVATEAGELRSWAVRLLAGESLTGIVRDLRTRGVPTVAGGAWTETTVRDILLNPRIAGHAVHRGTIVGPSTRPAVLDEDTWQALTGLFARRSSGPGSRDRRFLLSGLALCGSCRGGLYVHQNGEGTGRRMYLCRNAGCPGPRVGRDQRYLDEYVTGAALAMLGDLRPGAVGDPAADIRAELAGVEARLRQVEAELVTAAGRPPAVLVRAVGALEDRAEALRAAIAATTHRPSVTAGAMSRQDWDALPLDRRRAILRDLLVVTVLPTRSGRRGFDPTGVRIDRAA